MKNVIKVVLVDDEILFRQGIKFMLDREEDFQVVFQASNGKELLDYLDNTDEQPDAILTDLKMPVLNGVETTKILHKKYPNTKIIALTSYDSHSFVANMIDVGAAAFVLKNAKPEELLYAIRQVADKGFYYNEKVLKILKEIELMKKNAKSELDAAFLSPREIEVLQLICEQKNTAQIAEILFISPRTVEGHRTNLLLKTESKNIAGLVVFAIQNRLALIDM
ncbi:response regulator transcription factor [Flavobacterium sp. TAB 87]|uniref:response regulator transcription factor n=1 Tax=Flavobacterium sp. TAB 87 TaxID=1729581 RepID=UPI00076C1C6C|nr:response regulator transcription factor [Flavobacterium sp. TAB 87]KVV15303.1 Protease production enhancer protein [Flavobacterium sp. TAB 87]